MENKATVTLKYKGETIEREGRGAVTIVVADDGDLATDVQGSFAPTDIFMCYKAVQEFYRANVPEGARQFLALAHERWLSMGDGGPNDPIKSVPAKLLDEKGAPSGEADEGAKG